MCVKCNSSGGGSNPLSMIQQLLQGGQSSSEGAQSGPSSEPVSGGESSSRQGEDF
jgi:hypothetical protein